MSDSPNELQLKYAKDHGWGSIEPDKPNGANGNGAAQVQYANTPDNPAHVEQIDTIGTVVDAPTPTVELTEPTGEAKSADADEQSKAAGEAEGGCPQAEQSGINGSSLKVFAEDALRLGLKVFPIWPKKKNPATTHGFKDASSDPAQVEARWAKQSNYNIGIATGESDIAVLDFDYIDDVPTWAMDLKTLKVRTSRGVHIYVRGARKSADMYDATGKHIGEVKSIGGYVVGAGSIHPKGDIYTTIDDSPIAVADLEDKITELTVSNKPAGTSGSSGDKPSNGSPSLVVPLLDGEDIPNGLHDKTMHAHAGFLREHKRLEEYEEVLEALLDRTEQYIDRGDDFVQMAEKHASNACAKYPVGSEPGVAIVNGVPAGTNVSAPVDHFIERTPAQVVELKKELLDAAETERLRVAAEAEADRLKPSWISVNIQKPSQLDKTPLKWVIENFLLEHGLHLFSGAQGSTKTLLGLMLLGHVATNKSFMGRNAYEREVMVVYVDKENPEAIINERLQALGLLGLDNVRIWGDWKVDNPPPLTFDDPRLLECAQKDKPFFLFDSLSSFLNGANENDTGEMMQIMGQARLLARRCVGVGILHHEAKNGKHGGRGATSISASCDMSFIVEKIASNNLSATTRISEERFRGTGGYKIEYETNFNAMVNGVAGLFTTRVIENGLTGDRQKSRPVDPNPAHADEKLSDADACRRARDIIQSQYDQGQTVNKGQLAQMLGLSPSGRPAQRILTADASNPWSCIPADKHSVYFVPKGKTELPKKKEPKE